MKTTPTWARTTDGIVTRWESRNDKSVLTALRLSTRRLRLFAAGCCRSPAVWGQLCKLGQEAVAAAELYADGSKARTALDSISQSLRSQPSPTQMGGTRSMDSAVCAALAATVPPYIHGGRHPTIESIQSAANNAASAVGRLHGKCRLVTIKGHRVFSDGSRHKSAEAVADYLDRRDLQIQVATAGERTRQGRLLAGIAAPEWVLSPEWRTSTAVGVARSIYQSQAFDMMPLLADALVDAGCDNDAWLGRMRDASWPWCRGCRILDSLIADQD